MRRNKSLYSTGGTTKFMIGLFVTLIIAAIALAVGWVANIVALWHMTNILASGIGVLRVVGIFLAPLGGVLGLLYLF